MSVKEYITSKFQQFGIQLSDADITDISLVVDPDEEYNEDNRNDVYKSFTDIIPQYLLRAKSVSENGFSISWDNEALLRYYSWLCKQLDIDDNLNNMSSITDITDHW